MKKTIFAFVVLAFPGGVLTGHLLAQSGTYDLPNDDSGCPANCRQIPWKAGSDLWSGGSLPVFPGKTCGNLVEGNGTTDNTPAIQACINAAAVDTAVLIPAGMYYVNGIISLKSRVVLRGAGGGPGSQGTWINVLNGGSYAGDVGAGSTVTTLKLGDGGGISTAGTGASLGSTVSLSSGYTKGSTSLAASSAPGVAAGDWIVVSELQGDTAIPTTWTGSDGNCTWCGESNNSGYVMSQIVQVTSVSGNTIGISRPMYYTYKAALSPRLRKITNTTLRAGVESLKLWGSSNARTASHILMDGCMLCWIKGVETYNTPDVSNVFPVRLVYSYGAEVRDSYFHFGQVNGSGTNYGVGIFQPNSDHKIENNILRENRHGWSQEGGGSGNVFLYNYVDDQWTDDASYLGSPRANHGSHPFMALFEGNIASHFASDNYWGSSSHMVLFRNWFWGDATGNYAKWTGGNPSWSFIALELDQNQHYYSAVGNVLGNPNLHTNWTGATLIASGCSFSSSKSAPVVYALGCNSTYDPVTRSSMILHGNYDYKTKGVANWDGGSQQSLRASMYYSAKPAFFGGCAWPAFGPDLASPTNTLPAKARFEGSAACGAPTPPPPPSAPTTLQVSTL